MTIQQTIQPYINRFSLFLLVSLLSVTFCLIKRLRSFYFQNCKRFIHNSITVPLQYQQRYIYITQYNSNGSIAQPMLTYLYVTYSGYSGKTLGTNSGKLIVPGFETEQPPIKLFEKHPRVYRQPYRRTHYKSSCEGM